MDDVARIESGIDEPVVVIIRPNCDVTVNHIRSAYARNNFGKAVERWIKDGWLVSAQKEIAIDFLERNCKGLQLPNAVQAINSDSIITLLRIANDNNHQNDILPQERAPSSHSVAGIPRAISGQSRNDTSVNENLFANNETGYGTLERDIERKRAVQEKTESAESEPVRYSRNKRQGGRSVNAIRAIARDFAMTFRNAPEITVTESTLDFSPDAMPDGTGLFDPGTGKCWLFSRNLRAADDATAPLAHAVIAHYGLRGFFGDSLGDVLVSIRNHNPKVEKLSQEWWRNNQDYIGLVRRNEWRNWIGEQFENGKEISLYKK